MKLRKIWLWWGKRSDGVEVLRHAAENQDHWRERTTSSDSDRFEEVYVLTNQELEAYTAKVLEAALNGKAAFDLFKTEMLGEQD